MLNLNQSSKFKKDYRLCIKRGYDLNLLQAAVDTLRIPAPLPLKNKDHSLSGNLAGMRECHILPTGCLYIR